MIATDLIAPELDAAVRGRALDVTDQAAWSELAEWLRERHGRVDGLVNNAGIALRDRLEEITLAEVINAIDDRALLPRSALTKGRRSPAVDVLLGIWQDLHDEEQRALQCISLAELVRRIQEDHALSYQI